MNKVNKMKYVEEALAELKDTPIFDFDTKVINDCLSLYKKSQNDIKSMFSGKENDSCVFINLKPVSFEPRALFGSSIKTENAYEMSISKAMQDESGTWVPNESEIIVKFW